MLKLSKVLIHQKDNTVYAFAYAGKKLKFVTVDEVDSVSSEAVFRAKVCKLNHANQTAFIEYIPNATGYINLPSNVTVQDGSVINVQLSWLGNDIKQAKFRYGWELIGKHLIYSAPSKQTKITGKNVSLQLLDKLNTLLVNFPANWRLRSALNMATDSATILAEAQILSERANVIESRLRMHLLDIGVPNYCKLLRSFDLVEDGEVITNCEAAYDELTEWQDAWQLDVISYDKYLDCNDLILWYNDIVNNSYVELLNGSSLEINTVSGINIIDVNSGKLTISGGNLNFILLDSIYQQICLRNLQGIILIDAIKNMNQNDKQKIIAYLNKLFKDDITKCKVLGFSHSGLIELVRNKF